MKNQRGITLVEMLVVITVGSVLAGMAVATLASVLHVSRSINNQVHQTATVRRLAEQFRGDAHAALNTQSLNERGEQDNAGTAGRRFEFPSGREIVYLFQGEAVERTEKIDSKIQSHDSFILPKGAVATTTPAVTLEGNRTLATLILGAPKPDPETSAAVSPNVEGIERPSSTAPVSMRIEAVVAQDHRFMKPE